MDRFLSAIETALESPYLGGFAALIATAVTLSGKLDANAANWLLVAAWGFGTFSVSRSSLVLQQSPVPRLLSIMLVSSLIGLTLNRLSIWLVVRPVPAQAVAASPSPQAPSRLIEPSPPPVTRAPGTAIPSSPSAKEIAAALADQFSAPRSDTESKGPFPPFPLGGSLERQDFFDIILSGYPGRDVWRSVKHARDVEIDWSMYRDSGLIVDAVVRGQNFRVGLLDVSNDVVIGHSEWIEFVSSDLTLEQLEPPQTAPEVLRHIHMPVPRANGQKTYRLVVQPTQDMRPAGFWVEGAITFPSATLGGTYATWFTPSEGGPLSSQVPNAVVASIDWSLVKPPVNTVIADIVLLASYPVFPSTERCRVLIRDLVDNSVTATDWVSVSWTGGMMASRRYPGPVRKPFKLELPHQTGIHKYLLEVEVSKVGMSATATGTLFLRH